MPIATVQTPDGKTMTLEVPEGATQDQIVAFAEQNYTPTAAPQSQPEPSFYDRARDAVVGAKNVAAEFAAGANRTAVDTVDFIGPDTVNAALNLAGSDKQVPTLRGALEPYGIEGGFMPPGTARDVVGAAGNTLTAAGGLMQIPRNVATAGGALAEFAGIGSAAPVSAAGRALSAMEFPIDTMTDAGGKKLSLLRGEGRASTSGLMLDDAGKVVKDAAQKSAQWQGFEPGLTSWIRSTSPDTRRKMTAMLNIVEEGKEKWRTGLDARPLNVLGDSVLNRIKVVREANRVAAVRLNDVAKGLKGEQVDIAPAVSGFMQQMDEIGLQVNPETGLFAIKRGGPTHGMKGVETEANRVLDYLKTMNEKPGFDAFDAHSIKKWIDNNVSYTKGPASDNGMIDALDRAVKGLRKGVDDTLDSNFDAYNKINTQYAETREALDEIQDIAGKRFDPTADSADLTMGSLSRRFLSNAQSNGYLRDSVSKLDAVARKYITPGTDLVPYKPIQARSNVTPAMLENDDLVGLAGFADELDGVFGPASKTSIYGDMDKAVQRGIDMTQMTVPGMLAGGAKLAWKKAARINEQRAMKAMKELLKESN